MSGIPKVRDREVSGSQTGQTPWFPKSRVLSEAGTWHPENRGVRFRHGRPSGTTPSSKRGSHHNRSGPCRNRIPESRKSRKRTPWWMPKFSKIGSKFSWIFVPNLQFLFLAEITPLETLLKKAVERLRISPKMPRFPGNRFLRD